MNLEILKKYLDDGRVDDAISMIEELDYNSSEDDVLKILIEYLSKTDSHELRNAIAIALSDIGDSSAIQPLINTLQDERTFGKRGTLLYALQSFDCSSYIDIFINILINGYFEESRQSLILIESYNASIKQEIRNKYVEEIEKTIERLEDKIEVLYDSIDVLNEESDDS